MGCMAPFSLFAHSSWSLPVVSATISSFTPLSFPLIRALSFHHPHSSLLLSHPCSSSRAPSFRPASILTWPPSVSSLIPLGHYLLSPPLMPWVALRRQFLFYLLPSHHHDQEPLPPRAYPSSTLLFIHVPPVLVLLRSHASVYPLSSVFSTL